MARVVIVIEDNDEKEEVEVYCQGDIDINEDDEPTISQDIALHVMRFIEILFSEDDEDIEEGFEEDEIINQFFINL